jgi:hypothetical protein
VIREARRRLREQVRAGLALHALSEGRERGLPVVTEEQTVAERTHDLRPAPRLLQLRGALTQDLAHPRVGGVVVHEAAQEHRVARLEVRQPRGLHAARRVPRAQRPHERLCVACGVDQATEPRLDLRALTEERQREHVLEAPVVLGQRVDGGEIARELPLVVEAAPQPLEAQRSVVAGPGRGRAPGELCVRHSVEQPPLVDEPGRLRPERVELGRRAQREEPRREVGRHVLREVHPLRSRLRDGREEGAQRVVVGPTRGRSGREERRQPGRRHCFRAVFHRERDLIRREMDRSHGGPRRGR